MKRVVAEVLRGAIMPQKSQVWIGEILQIPAVAASRLDHCTLMDVYYKLYVSDMIHVHLRSLRELNSKLYKVIVVNIDLKF
jgi:hypothetical protein